MKKLFILFLFFLACLTYAQNEVYDYGNYYLRVENSTLEAFGKDSTLIYQKQFFNPQFFTVDLDSDYVNEVVVIDNNNINKRKNYTLFVFNTLDSLYIADSINSGSMEPYQVYSKELNTILLATGNAALDSLNTIDSLSYLPLNFWKFEDGALYLANVSVYDPYISENDNIIDLIEEYYLQNGKSCESTRKIKGAIASGFINYMVIGEKTFASQFLKNYYLCSDFDAFKQLLMKTLK